MSDTSDPLEILDAIDREHGDSSIGMIQADQVQRLRDEIVALRATKVLPGWTDALRQTRDEALEAAARACERADRSTHPATCADMIRALKGEA